MFDVIIPAIAVTMIFSIPFAFFAFVRYLRYKETIALAERGLLRPERPRRNRDTLRWGIIIMMLGLGLSCGLWPIGFLEPGGGGPFGLGPWMVPGIVPFFFGLGLVIIHHVNKQEDAAEVDEDSIPAHKRADFDEV
jgi:hypothetical protein